MAKLGLWKTWMQEYAQEFERTAGKHCTFAYCGGGWYSMHVDGEQLALRQRYRPAQVERMTAQLRNRPSLDVTQS